LDTSHATLELCGVPTSGENLSKHTKNGTILYRCPFIKNPIKPNIKNHMEECKIPSGLFGKRDIVPEGQRYKIVR